MLTKDTAICIRATDYSETSQILTLFTRQAGKISAIAKGSKRPKSAFDGPIEVFSYGKIVFSDSNKEKLATLTEFEQQPGFTNLASNLFALNCCFFATELVNNLTDDYDPHPELFDSFLQFLQNINELPLTSHEPLRSPMDSLRRTPNGGATLVRRSFPVLRSFSEGGSEGGSHELSLLILFQLSLLKEIGLQPILNACANCKSQYTIRNTQYEAYFSSSANGLICKDCEASFPDKIRLTKMAANCLANVKLIAESDAKTLNEIEKILIYHFTEILGRPPKMAKYILKS